MTSERFVLGTARKLATLMQHKLGGLQLIAVMMDGVRFADHVVLAAIGIDTSGNKRVLGLRESVETGKEQLLLGRSFHAVSIAGPLLL